MLATLYAIRTKYNAMQVTATNVITITDCVSRAISSDEPKPLQKWLSAVQDVFETLDDAVHAEIKGHTAKYIADEREAVRFVIEVRVVAIELSWYVTRMCGSSVCVGLRAKFTVDEVVRRLLSKDEVERLTTQLMLELLPHLYEKAGLNPGLVIGYQE